MPKGGRHNVPETVRLPILAFAKGLWCEVREDEMVESEIGLRWLRYGDEVSLVLWLTGHERIRMVRG